MKTNILLKQIAFLIIGLIIFTFSSCEKDELLEKSTVTELSSEAIVSEVDIEALVNGCYDPISWQAINSPSTHMHPVIFQDIRADNCISQWATYWASGILFDDFQQIQPDNTSILSLWTKWYTAIARANTAIELATNFENYTTDGLKERLIAEAKFVRALAYFELVKNFGGVPLITDYIESSDDELIYSRATEAEVYAQIEADLSAAATDLEDNSIGRATPGAAYALLAKAHLYQEEWSQVVTNCELVMGMSYALETNYADNWDLNNEYGAESVFEIGYADGFFSGHHENDGQYNQGSSSYQMFGYIFNSGTVAGNGGYGNCVPRQTLIDLYDDTDTRKDATFITPNTVLPDIGAVSSGVEQTDGEGNFINEDQWIGTDIYLYFWTNPVALESRATCRKYHLPAATTTSILNLGASPLNEKVIRYAGVLLMHAEASLNGGGGNGQTSLEEVTRRAYGGTLPADFEYTMDYLKLERRRELATEGWDRFSDLVRWGDAATALAFKNFTVGRDELLPIPQSEIDLVGSDILTQNPGY